MRFQNFKIWKNQRLILGTKSKFYFSLNFVSDFGAKHIADGLVKLKNLKDLNLSFKYGFFYQKQIPS